MDDDFFRNELIFYPHLLKESNTIVTSSLFPLLPLKERDEALICKNLLNSDLVTPSFDNSLLYLTETLLDIISKKSTEYTIYVQNVKLDNSCKYLKYTRNNYGFLVFKTQNELQEFTRLLNSNQWLLFKDYKKRVEEYSILLEKKNSELSLLKANLYNKNYTREDYSTFKFKGVHPNTNSRILKKLFEIVAPVCFIDYRKGSRQGQVRFKSKYGAQFAEIYFSREYIFQKSWDDLGSFNSVDSSIKVSRIDLERIHSKDSNEKYVGNNARKRKLEEIQEEIVVKNSHQRFNSE